MVTAQLSGRKLLATPLEGTPNAPAMAQATGAVLNGLVLGIGRNLIGILTALDLALPAIAKKGFIAMPLAHFNLPFTFPSKTRKQPIAPPLLVPKQPEVLLPFTLAQVTPTHFPNVVLSLTVQALKLFPVPAALRGQPIAVSDDYLRLLAFNPRIAVPPPRNTPMLPFARKAGQTATGLLALKQNTKRALALVGPKPEGAHSLLTGELVHTILILYRPFLPNP